MDKHKSVETQKSQQIFHFDEDKIEKICADLESEIETLKVVKNQNQPFKTQDFKYFKAALCETETITLLELPTLTPPNIKNNSDIQDIKIIEHAAKYMLSDAVQTSTRFQRTQHTQTEPITLKDQSNVAAVWKH